MKYARDLYRELGYVQWRRFDGLIRRARHLAANSSEKAQFEPCSRKVQIGSGASRAIKDYKLDASAEKLVTRLATAFKLLGHFPVRNEIVILDLLKQYCDAKQIRFEFQRCIAGYCFDAVIAGRIAIEFDEPHHQEAGRTARRDRAKNVTCRRRGITMLRFTLEDNIVDVLIKIEPQIERLGKLSAEEAAGYKGLYNGLGCDDIKVRKGIAKTENLMDRMDTTELAANQFRMTQARDKLARERIRNQQQAIRTHEQVGREVRAAIQRIGGTMPEHIKPAEHIKEVEKRLKDTPPKLELDGKDAKGLSGET